MSNSPTILGAIGNTPLLKITSLSQATGCEIYGKAEFMTPGGSIKDRPAKTMLLEALSRGDLQKGGLVVEATAGNTGVGLVQIANSLGCRCLFTCPAKVSSEKISLLRALGAEVVVCPMVPSTDPEHFQNKAREIAKERSGFFVNQFFNLDNMKAHYETTAPEIWEQTKGNLDGVACCSGTGGTIAGLSNYYRDQEASGSASGEGRKKVQVFLMQTQSEGILAYKDEGDCIAFRNKTAEEKEESGPGTLVEGVGPGKLYGNLAEAKIDGVFTSNDELGLQMCHHMLHREGLLLGGSAGLNLCGAYLLAKHLGPGHTVVTFLCDSGFRYLSKLYNEDWIAENFGCDNPLMLSLKAQDSCEKGEGGGSLAFLEKLEELNRNVLTCD